MRPDHEDTHVNIDQLIAEIERSEAGPGTAAIFDFDGTVIAGYSATVFLQDSLARGELSTQELVEMTRALAGFGLGNMGFSALMAVHAQYLKGKSESEYMANSERLFRKKIARLIYPEARRLIAAHRAKGHTLAIISSATPYQVKPAARDLNIDNVFCTELDVKRGKFTGAVKKPTVFGAGKVLAAEQLNKQFKAKLSQSFFYSDSTDDLQLLEAVGKPVTLNPSKRLAKLSTERQWPTASFDSRGKIKTSQLLRSIAATGSLVGSFAAGLPIYALTRSKRDSLNFSISLFADTCSALIGLDLDVHGEENLWSHRPAVFMFNHQSKADVAIMASLIRKDVVGVGKKEIEKMPVIGQVMGMAGTVFIDRSDREKAIESMQPLITAMKDQGKSMVIAPEGTRTPTPKLAPFKKGGFHMAMQVGVPIVPVVIHNASDIAPKGDFLFRPGRVRVDVLPPVDTTEWTLARMNEQVNSVRNMFLRALGQPEQSVAETLADRRALPDDMRPELNVPKRKAAKKLSTNAAPEEKTGKPNKATRAKTSAPKASGSPALGSARGKAKEKASTRSPSRATSKTKVQGKVATKIKTPAKKVTRKRSTPKATPVRPKLAAKES